jgi:DNA-binding SARP family transcriptional activator/tetratricopeptide (TPR) repeat protein
VAQRVKPVPIGASSSLEIRLLGELQVVRGGRVVPLPASKKTRALLAYLVATQGSHTRERLCELLWEGPDDPRAALRWSLAKLRPLLDDEGSLRLVADRERVSFEPHGASVDLYAIRGIASASGLQAASTEQLETATGLLRGELFEGLDLPDCYRYSEFCRAERDSVRGLQRAVRLALILRLGNVPERALVHARALCAANPLDEPAQVAVIELLAKLGRHKDALLQYETCRRILAAELRTRPSAMLERARSALGKSSMIEDAVETAPSAVLEPAKPRETSSDGSAPLVGRAPECAAIAELVRGAPGGETVLLILGEPGVGKTRLLEELARCVHAQGGSVLRGRAFEAEMIRPYGAWIDALTTPEAALFGSDPFAIQQGEGGADRARLFDAVVKSLRRLQVENRPVAVVIDDIHWIDEASAALIHYAVRALEGTRVRIACAARPGELGDNNAARRLVRALTRERKVCQIGLSPLGAADTAALVRSLGTDVDASRVFAESGGNPLFALEVARALAAGGEAVGSLDALLRDRLEQLDAPSRELVSWAAVLGGAFSPEVLMRVTDMAASTFARAAEDLERRGLIKPATFARGSAGYDFAHDLMRRAAYHAISEPRRRLMHAALARCLEALPQTEGALAGDVAHHAAIGDDAALAARANLAAAQRCVRLFANDEAAELVERGLHHVARLTGADKARIQVGLLGAAIYADPGRRRTAVLEPAMRRALLEAQAAGCAAEVTRGLMALSLMHFDAGDFAGAARDSLRAEQHARATTPTQTLHALAHSAQCLALLERELPRAEAMAVEAAGLADELGDDLPELWLARGLILYYRGEVEAAIAPLWHAFGLAERRGEHWIEALCLTRLAMAELHCGRPSAAVAHCQRLREVVGKMGESSEGPLGAVLEAVARRELAEPGAQLAVTDALDALQALDAQAYLAEALCFAAESDLRAHEGMEAEQRAQRALVAAEVGGRVSSIAWARALLARSALTRGDRDAARAQLDLAQALADAQPSPAGFALARIDEAARRL